MFVNGRFCLINSSHNEADLQHHGALLSKRSKHLVMCANAEDMGRPGDVCFDPQERPSGGQIVNDTHAADQIICAVECGPLKDAL